MAFDGDLIENGTMKSGGSFRLAENLNKLMKKRRVSISQAAQDIEMNKSTLHNYCNGVIPRNIMTLKKMAEYFEVGLPELLFGPQSMPDSVFRAPLLEGKYEVVIRKSPEESKKN